MAQKGDGVWSSIRSNNVDIVLMFSGYSHKIGQSILNANQNNQLSGGAGWTNEESLSHFPFSSCGVKLEATSVVMDYSSLIQRMTKDAIPRHSLFLGEVV